MCSMLNCQSLKNIKKVCPLSQKHLVVVDGYNFLFRAYYAVRRLTRESDGMHTNALFGFTQMLIKVVKDLQPDMCAVALDSSPTFRHEMYDQYKANRDEMDEEMKEQMPFVVPLIEAFGIPVLKETGFEADDIIATIAKQYGKDSKVTIVSSDKDLLQLITENVNMLDTMKNKTFGLEAPMEKFGVPADKVIEVQSLIGDTSDNIPGVKSVGPKTAQKLIEEFGTLENLYDNLEKVARDKLRAALEEHKENAFLSKKLVTLDADMDVDYTSTDLSYEHDLSKAVPFLRELEFKTLSDRLAKAAGMEIEEKEADKPASRETKPKVEIDYKTVDTQEDLKIWIDKIRQAGIFAIDTETTGLDVMKAELVGICLATEENDGCYIPLAHTDGSLFSDLKQLDKKYVLDQLRPILEDESIRKVGQNMKYDMHILYGEGIMLQGVEDTMLMSFCLDGGKNGHGMDELAKLHLGHACIPFKEVCGTGKKQITFDLVPIDQATKYAAEDADITLRLYNLFKARLDEEKNAPVKKVYEEIERPLIPTLMRMEQEGVLVDQDVLKNLSDEFAKRMGEHEEKIHELAGVKFNVASPKQMAEVLYDQLELPHKGKSRSTNSAALEYLVDQGHDIAKEIMGWRGVSKLRSTYTEALVEQINSKTGRVHTSYHQSGAATGRFSSSDPNLQNIPGRSEDGKKIRHAFIAKEGHVLMCADYSQVELRLLAHMSGSQGLQTAFKGGADIHAYTAHQIFHVPLEEVTSEQRSASKAINFGLVYGMGSVSLGKQIGVSRAEAKEYIDKYFERYDGVKEFMDGLKEFAHEHEYVETVYGRRINLPNINASNPMMRAGSERAAINAPLQGTNADMVKMVMPKVEQALIDAGLGAKMLMQVHDELIFEVPEAEVEQTAKLVEGMMENVASLDVPLSVGVDTADNWEDAH